MRTEQEREFDSHIGEIITLRGDGKRRFRQTHDATSVWDELAFEVSYTNKAGEQVWVEIASVTYFDNKEPQPSSFDVLVIQETGAVYRSYTNSGQLNRHKEPCIFDTDACPEEIMQAGFKPDVLRDPINFKASVRALEAQMVAEDFSTPLLYLS